jgi:NAD(P)-dependent dehydrogenase (short-subunit alcohol dehydrogenase family)
MAGKLRAAVAGKNVLVTGASYGIGEATARRLAAAGATVLLVARSIDRLKEVADEITGAGGTAHAYPVDLTDLAAVEALVGEVLAEHGHVDVVVSNAGKSIRRSVHLSYERIHDFERTMAVNYLGPVRLLLGLLPTMRARGQGHIVNVSSAAVRMPPMPRWGAYQASKTAFDVWLRSIAPEIHADGVTTTSIYMPLVRTRMSEPTPGFRRVPALRPRQAADLVARAIVTKSPRITPWWLWPTELMSTVARGPVDAVSRISYRNTRDSPMARGQVGEIKQPPAPPE